MRHAPWLEVVQTLMPEIRESARAAERSGRLPEHVVARLRATGLFRLLLPAAANGGELDPLAFVDVVEQLSCASGSVGWIVSQICVFSIQATAMPADVVARIWRDDPDAVVANGLPAGGHAVAVDGGYRVTGKFAFSSGCRHATWLAAGTSVLEGGKPRLNAFGTPEIRFLFLPRHEVTFVQAWDVPGLRATGSDQFTIDDKFVPAAFTAPSTTAHTPDGRAAYAIPMILYFAAGLATVGLGIARDALDTFTEIARGRTLTGAKDRLADQPFIQHRLAEAEAVLRSARAFLRATLAEITDAAAGGAAISLEQRALLRLASTSAMHRAAEAVDLVYTAAGTACIFGDHPLQRCFQDIHVLTQHLQGRESHLTSVGQILLGNTNPQPFV